MRFRCILQRCCRRLAIAAPVSSGILTSVMESPMVGTDMITFSHKGRVVVTYALLGKSSDDDFEDIRRRIFILPIVILDAIVWFFVFVQSELGPRPYS
jgi:hypothetical protein